MTKEGGGQLVACGGAGKLTLEAIYQVGGERADAVDGGRQSAAEW